MSDVAYTVTSNTLVTNTIVSTAALVDTAENLVQSVSQPTVILLDSEGAVFTHTDTSTVVVGSNEPTVIVTGQMGPPGPPGVPEEDNVYSKRIDFISDNEIYRGEAAVGSLTNSPVWRVRKVTTATDSDITEVWAGGTSNFDKVWDDRLSLTYI
jgi:hypothetical protein